MPITRPDLAPALRFTNARVLLPDGLCDTDLSLEGGRIAAGGGRAVDARGYLILPGIVDLHGDGFEHHLAPRRGAQTDPVQGLRAAEAEMAANGITTGVLAQFFSWEGGMRGPDFAEHLAAALTRFESLIDLRLQLRLEIGLRDAFPRAKSLIARENIEYVVLNDHLNHSALAAGKRPPRLVGQALKSGRSPQAHEALLQRLHQEFPQALTELADLTSALRARDVRLGSHDDESPGARATYRALGADIAEFPQTREAAVAARAAGEPVIMGAPNVVRGSSHDGRARAEDLIADGLVDALVSDYHYPAPARAALKLWHAGLGLERAWALISDAPARVMGWTDRGRIAPGLRADLVLIEADSLRIEGVIAGGRIAHLSGDLAARMIAG